MTHAFKLSRRLAVSRRSAWLAIVVQSNPHPTHLKELLASIALIG
jgi:hypothetical protein